MHPFLVHQKNFFSLTSGESSQQRPVINCLYKEEPVMNLNKPNYPIDPNYIKIILTYLPDYLKLKGLNTHERNKYHCLNPEHIDKHPSMHLFKGREDGKLRLKCQSCGLVLDLFNVVARLDHIPSFVDRYYHICNLFNINPDNPIPSRYYQSLQIQQTTPKSVKTYLNACRQNRTFLTDIWALRFIPDEIIDAYQLGYDTELCAYIIPVGSAGFIQRFTGKATPKYKRSPGLKDFFISKNFDNSLPFIIVEGEIDALSLLSCGYPNVIALGGVANAKECYQRYFLTSSLPPILALDLDDAGYQAHQQIIDKAIETRHPTPINFWSYISSIPVGTKDVNDLLTINQNELNAGLTKIKKEFKHEKDK